MGTKNDIEEPQNAKQKKAMKASWLKIHPPGKKKGNGGKFFIGDRHLSGKEKKTFY